MAPGWWKGTISAAYESTWDWIREPARKAAAAKRPRTIKFYASSFPDITDFYLS
jgi:hypothetical protein